jgi:hypothetical protein
VKPAGISGFGPGTIRGYDEPDRWTGRVLPSPDPYTFSSYSARGVHDWSSSITQGSVSLTDATTRIHKHFESASPCISRDCLLTVRYLGGLSDTLT